ncbi:MAG TPA: holo-ACP synthase [Anaerolineaceae bacterium]|nr:holo-ACP synthase [Anaerolineaceae bacterium]HPN51191.1 holo-ACP synthase [Anaerolineaceae bacterium]
MIVLRSGVDLVEIDRIEQLDPQIKPRFLTRVFTPLELEQSGGQAASLAARFAAKEAAAKALGCGIGPISWQDVEVARGENGEPGLRLHGPAAEKAAALGLTTWSLSLSHSCSHAVALVVACGEISEKAGA